MTYRGILFCPPKDAAGNTEVRKPPHPDGIIGFRNDRAVECDSGYFGLSLFSDTGTLGRFIHLRRNHGRSVECCNTCKYRFGRIRQTPNWIHAADIKAAYLPVGLSTGDAIAWVKISMPMASSVARVAINDLPGEAHRLPYASQIAPLTTKELKRVNFERPKNFVGGIEVIMGRKIICLQGFS